ncbi:MAG: MerR family transcriptional regulator, partial [Lachnospiraceae bacterium]|nr:MerR family transcriptional regulator [Lachnospiraceae bacterium]
MTIKEIETRSGMTRANIRFYESEGLLNPARNPNGYRDYSEEDLALLEKIRLLRTLQLSLADIRALQNGEETLSEALDRHLLELDRKDQEIDLTQEICRTMRDDKASFDSLDARHYLYAYEHASLIEKKSDSDNRGNRENCNTVQNTENADVSYSASENRNPGHETPNRSESAASLSNTPSFDRTEDTFFEHPIQKDSLPPVRAPWRRYFARTLDLSLYELGWFAFLELVFNTNIANLSFGTVLLSVLSMGTMLLVEPMFLKLFATTPGKWIMGFRVTDRDERHLTYGDGLSRTWTVLWRGMGLGIPIYTLVREWKSFHECNDGVTLEWDWDSELTMKDTHLWRGLALAGIYIFSTGLVVVIALEACMPRYRGDLTTAQFAQNYNRLASYFDYDSGVYLDENGIWVEYSSNVYSQGVTFYEWGSSPSPDVLDFDIVEEDGIIKEISFQYKTEANTISLSSYTEQMYLTALSFACAQKGFGLFSSVRIDLLNEISSHPIEGFSFSQNGITVTAHIESSGYITNYL